MNEPFGYPLSEACTWKIDIVLQRVSPTYGTLWRQPIYYNSQAEQLQLAGETVIIQFMSIAEPQANVRFIDVSSEQGGQRIDNFLLRILKGVPKSRIYRILRKGEVRVNRSRVQPDYRVQVGDKVRIPPVRVAQEKTEVSPPWPILEQLGKAVLFEDRELLVLDKPAGLAVHKGSGLDFGLIEALRALRPQAPFLELAHRLDRDTSGCLVLTKTPTTLRAIQTAQQAGAVDKRYLVLVQGDWSQGTVEVTAPLRKNTLRGGERMVEVVEGGKPAHSRFRPLSRFGKASLLEVAIITGRTHQIRVHAAYAGHPVAGDSKYGDTQFNREMTHYGLRRLFLHAHSIRFSLGNREVAVSAPLGKELKDVLEQLEAKP